MKLVENKDQEYMRSFKLLNNADVNETEMKESSSSSKYVSAYCRRKTIIVQSNFQFAIDSQNILHADHEADSVKEENLTPTIDLNVKNLGEIEDLMDDTNVETTSIAEGEAFFGPKKVGRISVSNKLLVFFLNKKRNSSRESLVSRAI